MSKDEYIIFYADDDEDDREFLIYAAKSMAIQVITFADGNQLINHLKSEELYNPDLFFIDINMPQLSGFECIKKLRDLIDYKAIPILMYSTSNDIQDMEKAKLHGADGYIIKPSNLNVLEKLLKNIRSVDWTLNSNFRIFGGNKTY